MDRQPTINDVAARAGVSKKTVSRVINNSPLLSTSTRQKVEKAIAELGYVPNPQARALALGRNFMIVLLHDNPNAQIVLNFERGVLDAIEGSDLALAVRPVDRNSENLLYDVQAFLERQRPIAALILPPISDRADLAELCARMGVRHVRVGSAIFADPQNCVASNDRETASQVCKLLIEKGHRRIGFVRGPQGFRSAQERELGFLQALHDHDIDLPDELRTTGTYRFASGVEAGEQLLSLAKPPTAIFASNDEMAAGVMRAAWIAGFNVPADLSVAGFDDSPTATCIWPQLTTVHWPVREMAVKATLKLVADFLPGGAAELGDGDPVVKSVVIERESVTAPRQS